MSTPPSTLGTVLGSALQYAFTLLQWGESLFYRSTWGGPPAFCGEAVPSVSPAGGVAPAGYRRHRNVKRHRKPLAKALTQ